MRLTDERIEQVLSDIQGSCKDFAQAFDETAEFYNFGFYYDDLDTEELHRFHASLDNTYFECVECGWWNEVGDYAKKQDDPSGDRCASCGEYDEDEQ